MALTPLSQRYKFTDPHLNVVFQDFRRKTNELIDYFLQTDFGNLRLYDTDQSNILNLKWNEDDSNPRDLNFKINKGNRTVDLSGNLTIESASLLNQDYTTDASPTFANLNLGATPSIRQASGALTIQTDEGVNTHTYAYIRGKGTGIGVLRIYDEDNAEHGEIFATTGYLDIRSVGTTPVGLRLQRTQPQNIYCWSGITEGNPYFHISGWHATDVDWMRMRVEADGDALIEAENKLNFRASGSEFNFGASPFIRQESGALTIQTNEGGNTNTIVGIKGKGTGYGELRIYDEDNAEYLGLRIGSGVGEIGTKGATPGLFHLNRYSGANIYCFASTTINPLFYIWGSGTAANEWLRFGVEADNDALIEAEHDLNLRAGGGNINLGDENLSTTGTLGSGALTLSTIAAGDSDYDKFLVSDSGLVKYRTGSQVLGDIGGQASNASLTSISGLTYVSGSFIALTAADTYAVRTYAQVLSDIGAAASSHAMSTHSDEDTYNINTSGTLTAGNATLGTIASADVTVDSKLVLSAGSITDVDGAISFGNENLTTTGYIGLKSSAELRFYDNGNYVGFEAPALSADQIWVLPSIDGGANQYLKTSGGGVLSWDTPSGAGDVVGSASATDNAITRFNGTTGKAIQNSGVIIDDSDNVGIGISAWGTSAAKVLGIGGSTAPTTSPANMVQLWSADRSAGYAQLYYRAESGKARPLESKHNVMDYGATGDGSTDDSVAIQAALDAMTNGGELIFPSTANYYKVTVAITVTNNDVGIITVGSKIKTTSHTVHVFNVSADDCYIEAHIEGSGTTVYNGDTYASLVYCTGDRLMVSKSKLVNPATVGIHFDGSVGSIVENNDIEGNFVAYPGDTHHTGIRALGIVKCRITGNRIGKCVQGITLGTGTLGAIDDDGESSSASRDNVISENRCWNNVDNNIYQSSGHRNIVTKNICKNSGQTNNIKVCGYDDIVTDNETYNSAQTDIVIKDGSGCIVSGNRSYNAGGTAIKVEYNSVATLYNCKIENNIIDSPTTYGINILETSYTNIENIDIKNNIIKDGGNYGIFFTFTTDRKRINICGNTVENSAHRGIYADHIIESQVCNNTVFNSGTGTNREGIYLLNSDNCIVTNNLTFDNQGTATQSYGLRVDPTCSNITCEENQSYGNATANFSIANVLYLHGYQVWDPGSILDGDESMIEVTVTGAALGDLAIASFTLDVLDLVLNAQVTGTDTVTCVLANNTGGAIDLGSGTLCVKVFKR